MSCDTQPFTPLSPPQQPPAPPSPNSTPNEPACVILTLLDIFIIVQPVRERCSSDILRTQCCLILYVQLGFLQLSHK